MGRTVLKTCVVAAAVAGLGWAGVSLWQTSSRPRGGIGPAFGGRHQVLVGGTVNLDGRSLEGAIVSFVPEDGSDLIARGKTASAGRFYLSTENSPGAVPGRYRVVVHKNVRGEFPAEPVSRDQGEKDSSSSDEKSGRQGPERKRAETTIVQGIAFHSVVPERYCRPDSTPLRFTVSGDPEKNDFKIELTSK